MHDYHEHKHTHEHRHADGSVHTHAHVHEHGHEHDHDHAHAGAAGEREELKALLSYMLSHNRHHAEELLGISERLKGLGLDAPAGALDEAISYYRKGNELLEKALAGTGE